MMPSKVSELVAVFTCLVSVLGCDPPLPKRQAGSMMSVLVTIDPSKDSKDKILRFVGIDAAKTMTLDAATGVPSGSTVVEAMKAALGVEAANVPLGSKTEARIGVEAYGDQSIFFAYIDINGDGALGQGEPYGSDPNNPVRQGVYKGTILINKIFPDNRLVK